MRALALVLGIAGYSADESNGPDAGDLDATADARPGDAPPAGASLGEFQLTYYWVTAEDEFPGAADTTIYTPACEALASVPLTFAESLDVEGTGRLADGTVINVSGGCPCLRSPCYAPVDAAHPWGYGVQDRALEPYRSVAVDRSVIAYGTPLYLPAFDGVVMPGDPPWGGFVHDGCAIAADTGGGIVGMHVDFFAGLKASYLTLDAALMMDTITVNAGGTRCP